jgi:L-fuculose-phosphate aldolase
MTDVNIDEALGELAIACRVLALNGHEDKTLGHLSLRDPAGRGLWLKRAHVGLAEIMGPEDFVLVDFDGKRLAGKGALHKEWPIHTEILKARPDVNVVGHTHPFYACLFAGTREKLRAVAHEACYFNSDVPRYPGTAYLIDTVELGIELAAALGGHSAVLMNNHGVTFCGKSTMEAGVYAITLEKACKQQLTLAASGYEFLAPPAEDVAFKASKFQHPSVLTGFWAYYRRQLERYEKLHGGVVVI